MAAWARWQRRRHAGRPGRRYFADDYAAATEHARLSALPTHAHPEGQAGAIAVAVAAAWAHRTNVGGARSPADLFAQLLNHTPDGKTREGIDSAADTPLHADVRDAVKTLGNGSRVTAPDIVPLCLWLAARHMSDYPEAVWQTIGCGGDIDTNCAIVGGIVAMSAPMPPDWLAAREALALD